DLTTGNDFKTLFNNARTDVTSLLTTGCGMSISACLAASAPDRLSPSSQNAADYAFRMSYGLPAPSTGAATVATVAPPTGSEVLPSTACPSRSAARRRDVLQTTELPTNTPLQNLDPKYAGYDRLNLYAAAGGYGAFTSDVKVTMNAALGGFN